MPTGTDHSALLRYGLVWREIGNQRIDEWLKENVNLDTTSPFQGPYDVANSPQLCEPLLAFQDEAIRMVTTLGPNQGGRTKAMEGASLWAIVNRPGPMQWNTYKDESAREFAEQRWWPAAKSCAAVVAKLPAHGTGLGRERFKEKIRSVLFSDGMPFKIQGCAESNLEEKSIMTQFNDECWQWPVGRLEIAHIRCNVAYAWNYKIWNGSVAGVDGDDIDLAFKNGSQEEWCWRCPKCGRTQIPRWGKPGHKGGVHWDHTEKTKPKGREWDYAEVIKTVRYECDYCPHTWPDSVASRRMLNEGARYIAHNNNAPDWHRSFRFNILSVNWPGTSWAQWVVEFLKSVDQMRRFSNLEPLRKFWSRRMTESWDESRHAMASHKVVLADYNLGSPSVYRTKQWELDRATGIGGEIIRFMAVDKQEWGYPFVIRAVTRSGESRLIERGVDQVTCCSSYTEVDLKSKDFGVSPKCVLIDSAFESREVYAQSVRYGWTCMRGVDRQPFRHMKEIVAPTGLRKRIAVELPYSEEQWADPFTGTEAQQLNRRFQIFRPTPRLARRFDWINLHIKNLLSAFKQGRGIYWGVPGDVGAEYIRQINAEVRHAIVNARGQRTEWWSNRTGKGEGHPRPNHAWDCYGEGTEVLTKRGWLRMEEAKESDLIATVNLRENSIEYQKPLATISKPYVGDMVLIQNGRQELFVTPTHRMVVYEKRWKKPTYDYPAAHRRVLTVKQARDLSCHDVIKATANWRRGVRGKNLLVKRTESSRRSDGRAIIDRSVAARFIGWFVTEGCMFRTSAGGRKVALSQKPDSLKEQILLRDLKRLPCNWQRSGDHQWTTTSSVICDLASECGTGAANKKVPQWLKGSSPAFIREFFETAVLGDGWQQGKFRMLTTISKQLADDYCELAAKAGIRVGVTVRKGQPWAIRGRTGDNGRDQFNVSLFSSQGFYCVDAEGKSLIKRVPYNGRVHCLTVPNGTLVVRYKGDVVICGNCECMILVAMCLQNLVNLSDWQPDQAAPERLG